MNGHYLAFYCFESNKAEVGLFQCTYLKQCNLKIETERTEIFYTLLLVELIYRRTNIMSNNIINSHANYTTQYKIYQAFYTHLITY